MKNMFEFLFISSFTWASPDWMEDLLKSTA